MNKTPEDLASLIYHDAVTFVELVEKYWKEDNDECMEDIIIEAKSGLATLRHEIKPRGDSLFIVT